MGKLSLILIGILQFTAMTDALWNRKWLFAAMFFGYVVTTVVLVLMYGKESG